MFGTRVKLPPLSHAQGVSGCEKNTQAKDFMLDVVLQPRLRAMTLKRQTMVGRSQTATRSGRTRGLPACGAPTRRLRPELQLQPRMRTCLLHRYSSLDTGNAIGALDQAVQNQASEHSRRSTLQGWYAGSH